MRTERTRPGVAGKADAAPGPGRLGRLAHARAIPGRSLVTAACRDLCAAVACANIANLLLARGGGKRTKQRCARRLVHRRRAWSERRSLKAHIGIVGGAAGITLACVGALLSGIRLPGRQLGADESDARDADAVVCARHLAAQRVAVRHRAGMDASRTHPVDAVRAPQHIALRATTAQTMLVVAATASIALLSVAVMLGQSLRTFSRRPGVRDGRPLPRLD